jgi:hypothetical protein
MLVVARSDDNLNAGSATCSPLNVTGEYPGFWSVTAAVWVLPTCTAPNDKELGLTVSGSVLYVIPQPVIDTTASNKHATHLAERRIEELGKEPERG